jgi:YHS domain-containing protein
MPRHHDSDHAKSLPPESHVDPVYRMTVDAEHAAGSLDYDGTMYYFCSAQCQARFRDDPQEFAKQVSRPASFQHLSRLKGPPVSSPAIESHEFESANSEFHVTGIRWLL